MAGRIGYALKNDINKKLGRGKRHGSSNGPCEEVRSRDGVEKAVNQWNFLVILPDAGPRWAGEKTAPIAEIGTIDPQ